MDHTIKAIEAQRRMRKAAAERDAALAAALSEGQTPYAIAKAFRTALGEDDSLTAEGIRRIGDRMKGKKKL